MMISIYIIVSIFTTVNPAGARSTRLSKNNVSIKYRLKGEKHRHFCTRNSTKTTYKSQYRLNNHSSDLENPSNRHDHNSLMGPPWFSDTENFPGIPRWMKDPREGFGPWFWRIYNGSDIIYNIGHKWHLDLINTEGAPAWFGDDSRGPGWSDYLFGKAD
jgi:hypothetical protein